MDIQSNDELEYVGFWSRVGATIIDDILLLAVIMPLMYLFYGGEYFESEELIQGLADLLLNYVFPVVAVLLFWSYKLATPGKMAINSIIVDANSGNCPTTAQFIIRYFGYIVSAIPLGLGYLWIGWDSKKQGWHDKLARTVVVRKRECGAERVRFDT